MDNVDIGILSCLKENARMNASEIGEKVNMSVSAVIERIRKMENAGVIKQYTLVLDAKHTGHELLAFVSVSIEHPKFNDSFAESVLQNKEIVECHYITGDFDFLLKIITHSTTTLERILNVIKSIRGVSLTETLVVLSTVKDEPVVLPDQKVK